MRGNRNQDIFDRISRAENDLLAFKSSQFFGKDVTTPKVVERRNSDGTPTQWDIYGEHSNSGGFDQWSFRGIVTYTAYHQTSPWAIAYAVVRMNPSDEIVSTDAGGVSGFFFDIDDLFNNQGKIRFDMSGSVSPIFSGPGGAGGDTTIDRLWVKIYILATDDGKLDFQVPYGSGTGSNGKGILVPTT